MPLAMVNVLLHRDHLFFPDGSMLRYTDKVKLIHLLEMLEKEEELEQGRLPSEVYGCVHEGPMDENTKFVQPFYQLRLEAWRKGSQL